MKTATDIPNSKVGRIVADDYRTAGVFSAYGIDFCCKGGISVQEACALRGLSTDTVVAALAEALQQPALPDYRQLTPAALADHIVAVHHKYVEDRIPLLQGYLEKLCRVHGGRHPELFDIRFAFEQSAAALRLHMKKEENILFPYIRRLQEAQQQGEPLPGSAFGSVEHPIHMMEEEHAEEGERFRQIEALSGHYTAPADGCQTYRVAYAMLKEFQDDLHAHIHLENNLLFPAAQALYHTLTTAAK